MSRPPIVSRAQLMRSAGDLLGSERFAKLLDIKPRTVYSLMNGDRRVKDGQLADTRRALIEHRQKIHMLVALIRDEEQSGDARP